MLELLWRDEFPNLSNNRSLALTHFLSLEKKFKNNTEFHKQYQKTIKAYIEKGHATKIKDENNTNNVINYLPHHGVVNIKVSVVFDPGATYKSTSLNKNLLKVPDLLNNLVGVLTRFRMGRNAVMGDIEQIFHQILVENKDRDVLRFLWRDNYIDPIEDYRMNVHLFGKVDSPCIANWTIKKTAADQSDSFDQISIKTIVSDFYMDGFLSSFHEISVAIKVCLYVINILQKGDGGRRGVPIDQIYFKQSFFTSSFTNEQYLSKINGNQPFCKRYTNRTSLGNIMEPRDGYNSYKIYTQISLNYQARYPISNNFNF